MILILGKSFEGLVILLLHYKLWSYYLHLGFPGGWEVKVSACNEGDPGSIPGSRRSPGEGNGNPLRYSCLENPMDSGRLQSTGSQRVGHDWVTSLSLFTLTFVSYGFMNITCKNFQSAIYINFEKSWHQRYRWFFFDSVFTFSKSC